MSLALRVRAFAAKAASTTAASASSAAANTATAAGAAATAAATADAGKPKEQRKAFDFSTVVFSTPPEFKLSGQADSEYPEWLADIKKGRPSLREITKEHDSFTKLKRRGDIKTHNEEQGI